MCGTQKVKVNLSNEEVRYIARDDNNLGSSCSGVVDGDQVCIEFLDQLGVPEVYRWVGDSDPSRAAVCVYAGFLEELVWK